MLSFVTGTVENIYRSYLNFLMITLKIFVNTINFGNFFFTFYLKILTDLLKEVQK